MKITYCYNYKITINLVRSKLYLSSFTTWRWTIGVMNICEVKTKGVLIIGAKGAKSTFESRDLKYT